MKCSNCGQPLVTGAAFCGNCGQPVVPAGPTPVPATPIAPNVAPLSASASPPAAPAFGAPPPIASMPVPQPPYTGASVPLAAPLPGGGKEATAGFVLGILSLVAWIIPLIGVPVSITAFVLGFMGLKSSHRKKAITAIVLAVISVPLIVFSGYLGYKNAKDKLDAKSVSTISGANTTGDSINVTTNCFSTSLDNVFLATTEAEGCKFKAVDPDTNTNISGKAIPTTAVTKANLAEQAAYDLKYAADNAGGEIVSQSADTFKGEPAYKGVIKTPDGYYTAVEYMYHTPGYTIAGATVKLFAIAYATQSSDTSGINNVKSNWSWK